MALSFLKECLCSIHSDPSDNEEEEEEARKTIDELDKFETKLRQKEAIKPS